MPSQNENQGVIGGIEEFKELKKLIISAKGGDKDAFEKVYTKLFTPLYRYVISKCHDTELSQDICQQTFLNFYKSLDSYEPEKHPLAYLFTIAKRLLINHGEKRASVSFDETIFSSYVDESVDIVDDAHVHLLAKSINEYVPMLTEDEQEVIRLFFYAELGYKEISAILQKEEAHIRKIKERALKKLRHLTHHLYEGN
jgi:RNA polymerase sigma-70 factor (ECF subfamily)